MKIENKGLITVEATESKNIKVVADSQQHYLVDVGVLSFVPRHHVLIERSASLVICYPAPG